MCVWLSGLVLAFEGTSFKRQSNKNVCWCMLSLCHISNGCLYVCNSLASIYEWLSCVTVFPQHIRVSGVCHKGSFLHRFACTSERRSVRSPCQKCYTYLWFEVCVVFDKNLHCHLVWVEEISFGFLIKSGTKLVWIFKWKFGIFAKYIFFFFIIIFTQMKHICFLCI